MKTSFSLCSFNHKNISDHISPSANTLKGQAARSNSSVDTPSRTSSFGSVSRASMCFHREASLSPGGGGGIKSGLPYSAYIHGSGRHVRVDSANEFAAPATSQNSNARRYL